MSAAGRRRRDPSRRRPPRPEVPALPPGLSPLDAEGLRARSEHTDVELVGLDLPAERLTRLSLETARVKGCRLEGAELRGARFARVVFDTCDFANTSWFDCELTDVAFLDCRFTGASLSGGRLSEVVLRACQLRLAKLSHLGRPHALLERCDFRGALLMESDFCDVRFADCDLESVELFNVDLKGNDLRDNELGGLKGVGCLRGATIDALQLLSLAPALAAHVGLTVEEAIGEGA
jgi:uncharacterized protein YjbI with pentapeptide repeats